jgi:hypothetical protein
LLLQSFQAHPHERSVELLRRRINSIPPLTGDASNIIGLRASIRLQRVRMALLNVLTSFLHGGDTR